MGNENSAVDRNLDKRSARRKHGKLFQEVIRFYRKNWNVEHQGNTSESNIKVCVRKRPIFEHEKKRNEFDVVTCKNNVIVVHDCRMAADMKAENSFVLNHEFTDFDTVFSEHATNDEVYSSAAKPLVDYVMQANTATIFMYGQTGSGKTYTMNSIMEKAAHDLFAFLEKNENFSLSFSYFEMAGQTCFDLLNDRSRIQLMEGKDKSVNLFGAKEEVPAALDELLALIRKGQKLRNTQSTGVNETSSRTHAILRIFLKCNGKKYGQLTLVDLAGSERNEDSKDHNAERRREGAQINYSLMALKDCVRVLSNNRKTGANERVPYRTSKLTQLLKDCFTNRKSKTLVFATCSPIACDTEHTVNTLTHTNMMHMTNGKGPKVTRLASKDVLKMKSKEKPAAVPPIKWTEEECRRFICKACNGKFAKFQDSFPNSMNGKMLMRHTAKRFAQICGDENLGIQMRRALDNAIEKANRERAAKASKKRELLSGLPNSLR